MLLLYSSVPFPSPTPCYGIIVTARSFFKVQSTLKYLQGVKSLCIEPSSPSPTWCSFLPAPSPRDPLSSLCFLLLAAACFSEKEGNNIFCRSLSLHGDSGGNWEPCPALCGLTKQELAMTHYRKGVLALALPMRQ